MQRDEYVCLRLSVLPVTLQISLTHDSNPDIITSSIYASMDISAATEYRWTENGYRGLVF